MTSPEQKLKRFLHHGREIPLYQPGDRLKNSAYHPSELQSVDTLIANENSSEAAACIVKAFSDGYSAHPEMLVYALAICVKQKSNKQLTAAAYKALKTVCTTPGSLFLFIKFATKLSTNGAIWGNGFRKVVKEWYLKKDPKTLAEIILKNKKYHGWSHKDVMKLTHLKSEDPATAAVIKYTLYNIATAKKAYGDVPGTSEVLNYIQAVEDFKHMTDEQQAARTVESLGLTLDHIPARLLKNIEIWNAVIGNLPLRVLINNLERMGYLGFLKPNSPLVTRVLDALSDERLIAESHLHPAEVFIAMKKYERSSKFIAALCVQKCIRENGRGDYVKVLDVPPKPNSQIVIALNELFASTCKLFLAPTGMRYLVAFNLKLHMFFRTTGRCYKCPCVGPSEAAVVTTLCLLHADRNVSVVGLSVTNEIVNVPLTSRMTIQNVIEELKNKLMFTARDLNLTRVIQWAGEKKKEYDVFVYITEFVNKAENSNIISSLNQYRTEMNLPNAKLVVLSLLCNVKPTLATSADDPGIFDIAGFDGNVPRLIEAFSRGAF